MMQKQDEIAKLIEEVEKFDAKPAEFYSVLAEQLEGRRHYAPAEKYFQKAIELRSMVPGPANKLGLLYMRMGREKDGADVLAKAFKSDPFNVARVQHAQGTSAFGEVRHARDRTLPHSPRSQDRRRSRALFGRVLPALSLSSKLRHPLQYRTLSNIAHTSIVRARL